MTKARCGEDKMVILTHYLLDAEFLISPLGRRPIMENILKYRNRTQENSQDTCNQYTTNKYSEDDQNIDGSIKKIMKRKVGSPSGATGAKSLWNNEKEGL